MINIAMVAALAGTLVSCSEPRTTVIEVTPAVSLLDEPVHIKVTGLDPGQRIELEASMPTSVSTYSGRAAFTADGDGVVDLDRDAPVSGGYTGVDGMGLIASMQRQARAAPSSAVAGAIDFPLTVATSGGGSAVTVRRQWIVDGVTTRTLDRQTDGVAGVLFSPAKPVGPGVLLIGGSEGGVAATTDAAMLASRGYPTLALAYFHAPGLPDTLRDIPIEYFAAAARLLPGPVRVIGISRGSEAALLLSGLYPDLVRGTVLVSPAASVNIGYPDGGNAWTFGGKPQTDIPFDAITDPVLAIVGTADAVWNSAGNAVLLRMRLKTLQSLVIDGAGHDVFSLPYLSRETTLVHPVSGQTMVLGGTPLGNEKAHRQSWARVLQFLAGA